MKTIFIDTFQYSSYLVQCVCVDGEPWFRGDHVATILGYTNTTEALNELDDDDDVKTLGELLANSDQNIFISCYGLHCLVYKSKKQDADKFRRWIWFDVIKVVRNKAPPPPEHCSDDGEASMCSNDSMVGREEEEAEYDFSTNSNPKYWLRKLKNKTALIKECDKRGVIIDNAMMTLNVDIITALIDADSN